jgi:hypothetical protein
MGKEPANELARRLPNEAYLSLRLLFVALPLAACSPAPSGECTINGDVVPCEQLIALKEQSNKSGSPTGPDDTDAPCGTVGNPDQNCWKQDAFADPIQTDDYELLNLPSMRQRN